MARLRFVPQALNDLDDIWYFIALDDEVAADRFVAAICHRCELIADSPAIGRVRPELAPELRSLAFRRYVIFYRPFPGDADAEIIRVLSASRDIGAEFFAVPDWT